MDDVVEAVEVDVDHALPVLLLKCGEGVVAGDACVEDDAPVGAVGRDVGLDRRAGGLGRAHIEEERADLGTRLFAEADGLVHLGGRPAAVENERVPRAGELDRAGASDAARGACDENGFLVVGHDPFLN